VLDSTGKVVHSFDGFRQANFGRRESLAKYTARELSVAVTRIRLPRGSATVHPLRLPDLSESRGIRVFVRLKDPRMKAYQAPVVEVVPLNRRDWQYLAFPQRTRKVSATVFKKWLSQVYPPGVMERTDPHTKEVYRIKSTEGELTLTPAGSNGQRRYALLSGTIRLTDEGRDGFSYTGQLNVVLSYGLIDGKVISLRGVFEGTYPREDRLRRQTRHIPLQAAFESRPETDKLRLTLPGKTRDGQ
jgi:hypothetical protein